jgi:hypothetical protein
MGFADAIIPKKDQPAVWFFGEIDRPHERPFDPAHVGIKGLKGFVLEGAEIAHFEQIIGGTTSTIG